jgi:Tfp pilus assembly protein PilF
MRVLALAAACAWSTPVVLSAQGIGTVEYDLNYGREYLAAGNPSGAAVSFRQAVALHPDHAEANLLLAVALQRSGKADEARPYFEKAMRLDPALADRPEVKRFAEALGAAPPRNDSLIPDAPVTKGAPPAPTRAAPASAAATATRGDPQQVGTAAYFLRYAKYHMSNADYGAAASYARQALAVDPDFAEAKQLLAQASRQAAKPAPAKNACDAQFSSCWAGAMTYTPGSGYSADNARRQQCMVERNICSGR